MQIDTRATSAGIGSGSFLGAPSAVWLLGTMLVAGTASSMHALFTHAADAVALSAASGAQLVGWVLAAAAFWRRRPLGPTLCSILWSGSLVLHALGLSPVLPFMDGDAAFFLGLGVSSWGTPCLSHPAARAWFGLQCPQCGSQRVKLGSLGLRRLACRACAHGWDSHAPRAADPTPSA